MRNPKRERFNGQVKRLQRFTKDHLLHFARSSGLPLSEDFTKEELVRLLAHHLSKKKATPTPKAPNNRHLDLIPYEAVWSDIHNCLVRYVKEEDGQVTVAGMNTMADLPGKVLPTQIHRPSAMDATTMYPLSGEST